MPYTLKRPEPLEAQVQRAVLQVLSHHPRVAWAARINTGVFRPARKDGSTGFVRAGFKGCSDVIGQLTTGQFLAIEVKRPSGKTTPEQQAFLQQVAAHGGIALVARSADDVIAALGVA
jgi:hypothetical protein